jgi:hypothetical protein
MVKLELDAPFQRFTDKIGKLSYRWMYGKQTVIKTPEMSKVKWSGAQKAIRERFREAIAYARAAMADPKVRAYYQKVAKKANRQPFCVAVSYFCAGKNLLKSK